MTGSIDATTLAAGATEDWLVHAQSNTEAPVAWTADGDQALAFFGSSVSGAGDVNGDGFADVIVGARRYDTDAGNDVGRAYVYYGSSAGLSDTPAWTADGDDQAGALFGSSVSAAGDVNGDGFDDVIVGAWLYDTDTGSNAGRAYVYYGSSAGLADTPAWTADGDNQAGALFGSSVSAAGDVNGDGFDDVIIAAPEYDVGSRDDAGRTYVYHGSSEGLADTPAWTADGERAWGHFGLPVSAAGDVNGDGFDDVIVAAPDDSSAGYDAGRVYVYHGSSEGLANTPALTVDGEPSWQGHLGVSVGGAGDVNGDGFDDVIVGVYYQDTGSGQDSGRVYIHLGSNTGVAAIPTSSLDGDQAGARFGSSVSAAGDVNDDGFGDVIVGSPHSSTDSWRYAGRAYVYHGSATGLLDIPASAPDGDRANARFGSSVSAAGDVDGDGFADVIVAAPQSGTALDVPAGRAYVHSGHSSCGNSIVEGDEECDDGVNDGSYGACMPDCTRSSFCGDGVADADHGELCDGTDLTDATCEGLGYETGVLGCDTSCSFDTTGCETCGDGVRSGTEACDGTDIGGQSCLSLGFDAGTLACYDNCTFDVSECQLCGNNTIEGTEICDGTDFGGESCASQGYDDGVLLCNVDCSGFYTVGCTVCGNGLVEYTEACDGTELRGMTCADFGMVDGTLACAADCTFDISGCEALPTCLGDGVIDPPEQCDGSNLDGASCESLGFDAGILSCSSNCTYDTSSCVE